ncbi:MAG: terminase large subunit domain-containing protein [Candidatus Dormibacteraceae bacterium]
MRGLVRFAREQLGVELYPGQIEVLDEWAASGKRKAVLCLGRRSGKGIISATAAIFNAVIPDYSTHLRPGETRFIVIVATKEQQAREHIRVIRELLANAPDLDLRTLVDSAASTTDEVVFTNGVVVRAMPCSARSVRGLAASLVIFDEFAHFQTETEGYQAARTVWRALTPSVAQFKQDGYVLVTSTPLWPSGPFYDLFQQGMTGADSNMFVARRPTWEVNANITRADLDAEFLADPEGAAVEFGADFSQGLGAYLDPVSVHSCVKKGLRDLPPLEGVQYIAAADPAFAAGGDAFAFAIAHRQGDDFILDRLQTWRGKDSPLNSDAVLDEIAGVARQYRVDSVVSDQYAIVPLGDALRRRGIVLRGQPLSNELKADMFGALKRAINLGQAQLLDDANLINELVHLELRPTPSGKPRIAAAAGHKDDRAMVVATAIHALAATADPSKSKWYGSAGASADEWIDLMKKQAEEARPEQPQITIRQIKLGGN